MDGATPQRLVQIWSRVGVLTSWKSPWMRPDTLPLLPLASVPAGIADAVTEQVAARDEAADDRTVALLAAFSRAERNAGDVLEPLLDGGGVLLLDDRLRDDVDGLRHVEDRHRQPGDAGIGDLIRGRSERRVGAARSGLVRRHRLGRRRGSGHRARGRGCAHRGRGTRPAGLDRNRGQRVGLLLGLRGGGAGGRLLRRALFRRALLRRRRLLGGVLIAGGGFRLGLQRAAEIEQRGGGHHTGSGPYCTLIWPYPYFRHSTPRPHLL